MLKLRTISVTAQYFIAGVKCQFIYLWFSLNSTIGTVTPLALSNLEIRVRFALKARDFLPLQSVEIGSGTHTTPFLIGTGGSFSGRKAVAT